MSNKIKALIDATNKRTAERLAPKARKRDTNYAYDPKGRNTGRPSRLGVARLKTGQWDGLAEV